ncbi:Long-chain-alcohol oxidase FAO2-like protein 1 [Colletotrichum chlorophyti]|uniref:Long-chain-alcohol oxidase n=1 Tax=Colletotrichum chlorophyti TaxID=708187 RepID=A0A1Q8S1L9_9PEZI|nr:Long-chain-alcohol oxidase FAO2-like protein 1 [Colletotrichum chlorophyti]
MSSAETRAMTNTPCLPQLQPTSYWTDAQWDIFWSLLEAVLPAIHDESSFSDDNHQLKISNEELATAYQSMKAIVADAPSEEQFRAFLAHSATNAPAFRDNIRRTVTMLHQSTRTAIGGLFAFLGTRAGSLLLTNYWKPPHQQPLHIRQAILMSWHASRLPSLRSLARVISSMALKSFYQSSDVFRELSGWNDLPGDHQPGHSYDFTFRQFEAAPHPDVMETDVVIIGSGCGGAVCAQVLAEAGYRVAVVEKSYHFPPSQLPMSQELACHYLFENGGFIGTDDGSTNVLAGSCWGGGGSVNWSVSLQTQGYVRKEWADENGLPFFTSTSFQDSLDRVCEYMGVDSKHVVHNKRASYLLDGSHKLGWHAGPAPQNTGGEVHNCGRCHLGCRSNKKKGPAASWLPAAAKAGGVFVEGLDVERVLFDEMGDRRRAIGVRGKWISRDADGGVSGPVDERITRDIIIKAKRVIVAAGALFSPLILMRSGLTNRHIGQNLRLHPTTIVIGVWKEDLRPWEGDIISAVNYSFENLDSRGHGVKLEPTCMVPYAILSNIPWRGGLESQLDALNYRNSGGYIILTRDRDSGRVYPDPVTGLPHVDYHISDFDRNHTLEGVLAMAKICYIEGAQKIHVCISGVEPFIRDGTPMSSSTGQDGGNESDVDVGINDPRFVAWLDHVRQVGNKDARFVSAHQMSSCRMGVNEHESVVDHKGRVFGTEGLYVADASVLPSASGVNPMVTTMAIADWISHGIARDLKISEK